MSQILNKEDGKVVIAFSATKEEFAKGLDQAFKRAVKRVNAPGFRKGKLPRAVFNKMYGEEALFQDAVDFVLPAAYTKAIDELEVSPLAMPDIDVKEISKEEGVEFEAVVTVKPNVELGEYKNLGLEKDSVEVTDADVEERLDSLLSRQAEWQIKEGESKKGDIVVIDFKGFIGDEAFEGGEAKGYELELGSGSFIPGFEEQLEGKVAPVDTEVNVTFPEAYGKEDLNGKPAKFEVTVKEIKVKELPALDDEFAKEVSEFDTLEELKADLKEKAVKANELRAKREMEEKVINAVVDNAKVEIPEAMINREVENMVRDLEMRLGQQGLSLEQYYEFTGSTEDKMKSYMKENAERKVKTDLVMSAITEAEAIEATEEELKAKAEEVAKMYSNGAETEKMVDLLLNAQRAALELDVKREKTLKMLFESLK